MLLVVSTYIIVQIVTGIPISHQHLIWQGTELENDYCLSDYPIQDGATLKLVLNMRGGPINTRRSEYSSCKYYWCIAWHTSKAPGPVLPRSEVFFIFRVAVLPLGTA